MNYTNATNTIIAMSKGSVLLMTELELLQDGGETGITRLCAQDDRKFAPIVMA